MEAGARFGLVGEARAQVCVLIGADDAEISQREVLEIILRLPKIKIQQELDRLRIAQRNELAPAAMIMCCFEGDVCEKIVDQLRLGPGGPNISESRVLPAFDQRLFCVAEDEVDVIAFNQRTDKVTVSQFFERAQRIGNLGIAQCAVTEEASAPVDHPDQKALRIL
jgi:hypothetical protein